MMNFTENKKFKKIGIGLAVALLVCILIYIIKPIYYRVYPFDRFTVNYNISYNGEEVDCKEKYYSYEDAEYQAVRNTGSKRFKIRGGSYGPYTIGLVVKPNDLYAATDDDVFLSVQDDFKFSFYYFNTNWWHITDINIDIKFIELDGEWYVECKQVITEPDVDESGRTHTDAYEGKFLLKDINTYKYLPLSDEDG